MSFQNSRDAAILYINNERHEVRGEQAFMMLADYLRYERGLVGTKIVCAEGDCGACSVLKASYLNGRSSTFEAINACIITIAQLDGCHIVTVEGLSEGPTLSPVQEAIATCHGSQCGYCTPGFAVAITACLQNNKTLQTEQEVKNCLTGNLCRCTGYTPLIEAAFKARARMLAHPSLEASYQSPEKHRDLLAQTALPLHIKSGQREFLAPTTLKEALRLRELPQSALMGSGTDLGVQINKGKADPQHRLSFHLIPELYEIAEEGGRLRFGARVTLSEVRRACENCLPEFAHFLNIFASPQIKNVGTLVGNVANASPIGDTIPFLLVSNTLVHVASSRGERSIPLTEYYLDYRVTALENDEIIVAISFELPGAEDRLRIFKVSQRKDLDISTVNSAFHFRLEAGHVIEARMAYGGVGPTVKRFPKVESYLLGKRLTAATIDQAIALIQSDIAPLSDVRGTSAYRRSLVDGLFRRYCEELEVEIEKGGRHV